MVQVDLEIVSDSFIALLYARYFVERIVMVVLSYLLNTVARQHQQLLSLLLLPKIRGNTGSYYSSYIMLCIGRVVWLSLSLSL